MTLRQFLVFLARRVARIAYTLGLQETGDEVTDALGQFGEEE